MKNLRIVSITSLLLVCILTGTAFARTGTFTGTISEVQFIPKQSAGEYNLTAIKFNDGKIFLFKGIILGHIFEIGKKHTLTYDEDWTIISVQKE